MTSHALKNETGPAISIKKTKIGLQLGIVNDCGPNINFRNFYICFALWSGIFVLRRI